MVTTNRVVDVMCMRPALEELYTTIAHVPQTWFGTTPSKGAITPRGHVTPRPALQVSSIILCWLSGLQNAKTH